MMILVMTISADDVGDRKLEMVKGFLATDGLQWLILYLESE